MREASSIETWTNSQPTAREYDGTHIRLRQSKTGKRVIIPVGKPLRLALDALKAERRPKEFDVILLNTRGKAWTGNGFSSSFRKATAHCGIEDLTFHDTRGTAVTRMLRSFAQGW